MATRQAARNLARAMVNIGRLAGRQVTALITQMEQPLGSAVGHALEIKEAIAALHGAGPPDFQTLVENVASEMILLGSRRALTPAAARQQIRQAIRSGSAFAKFKQFVAAQGGDVEQLDHPERLPQAPVQLPLLAPHAGYIARIDGREIGLATVDMGGGRQKKGDPIDPAVGVIVKAKVGQAVKLGDELCVIHAANSDTAQAAAQRILAAYAFSQQPVKPLPIIYERVRG
jgi:pyrimidine-nucleoside phosphorylase